MKNNLIISVSLFLQMNSFILQAQDICNNTENPQISFVSAKANLVEKMATLDLFQELDESMSSSKNVYDANNYLVKTDIESIIAISSVTYVSSIGNDLATPIASSNETKKTYYNSQYKIPALQETVSWVDTDLDGEQKFVLRVDGKPFYMTNIQVRLDKLHGNLGWDAAALEKVIKRAADDGFNTLSIPIFWREVEPVKDRFDWTILDEYMGWCKKYNVKMEMLWFSWSSGGRVQWLINDRKTGIRVPRTPDYVCSADGKSEYNMLHKEWEYSLDWRDEKLRDRDKYVLGKIMEHIAFWEANNGQPHTVIGVQLGNEARSHGDNKATSEEIVDYYHHVGAAVKESKYVVWTRLNCVSHETRGRLEANEAKRNNGGTHIDFVGIDIYGTTAESVKGNMRDQMPHLGKNYTMIMEIDAKDSNSPVYQMAALAGDKAFDYYNMAVVDGNELYAGGEGTTLIERDHVIEVRNRNKILNLDNEDVALKANGEGLYVFNYAGNSTNTEAGLDGISFTPATERSQAVSIRHSPSEIVLLVTENGTFNIPPALRVVSASKGYFDKDNKWVSQGEVAIKDAKIIMPATSAVLLKLK